MHLDNIADEYADPNNDLVDPLKEDATYYGEPTTETIEVKINSNNLVLLGGPPGRPDDLYASTYTCDIQPGRFITDSGSGTNIGGDLAVFTQYEEFTTGEKVYKFTYANGASGVAKG